MPENRAPAARDECTGAAALCIDAVAGLVAPIALRNLTITWRVGSGFGERGQAATDGGGARRGAPTVRWNW